jgi:DNA repair exonuclease SbcCD ATPase subunit
MIERVRLRNFRRYKEATLALKPGVNFIEGQNNVGKTSLFYAIEYALFGRVENFKTIRSLMQPKKRSLGVEIVFRGPTGERYLLQRAHIMPPKSKTKMDGHFTLKALGEDAERYLLASDFGDTEDQLALKLQELTGLTRRLFSVALHMRQGDIAAILDGAKQLDIVLGVTAAAMAEDELRQMALELEKETAGLAVLQERLRALGGELAQVAGDVTKIVAEQKQAADKLAALSGATAAGAGGNLDELIAPLLGRVGALEEAADARASAEQRLADEKERRASAGDISAAAAESELAKLKTDGAGHAAKANALRAALAELGAARRKLDQRRGDLAGRITRRQGLSTDAGATCEACGAPIDASHVAKELTTWTAELEALDAAIEESEGKQAELRDALATAEAAERAASERAAELKRVRDQLSQLEAAVAKRQKEFDAADTAAVAAFAGLRAEADSVSPKLAKAGFEPKWALGGDAAEAVESVREAVQALRTAQAERAGRQTAQRQGLTELLERIDAQAAALTKRQSDLEREQATAAAEVNSQTAKAARAARFRRLSAGFKELQTRIRSDAATKLAADTLALHRQLSQRDEFEALTIDSTHYAVQVVPRDIGEEVPAGLYEGGGHRLLLGLAFRLAVARLVEHCPFLLLDEPTYGLDAAHREALLNRIADLTVAKQYLLVTHQAMGDVAGNRIQVARQGKETVVVENKGA